MQNSTDSEISVPIISHSTVSDKETTTEMPIPSMNQEIQNRIQYMQRIQHLQFLQKLEQQQQQQQQQEMSNVMPDFQKILNQRSRYEQKLNKVNLVNSNTPEKIRSILTDFNKQVIDSIEKIEKIDVDEIKNNLDRVFEIITTYNDSIDTWYDEKFHSDKQKLYESIEMSDKNLNLYEKMDFISVGYTD